MTFHRSKLAQDMASQLLRPKGLLKKVRSGLFLGGLRRIGKTTFLRGDLIPALEAQGAIVVYVDLWSNTAARPSECGNRRPVWTWLDWMNSAHWPWLSLAMCASTVGRV